MELRELLEKTREKYKNERDPSKRKVIEAFGRSLKSYIDHVEFDNTVHAVEQHLLK